MGLATSDPSRPSPIRVAIIETDRRIREGLAMLIDSSAGYRCAVSFRSLEEALRGNWNEIPELALVDISLSGLSGNAGLGLLRRRYPSVVLLVLTVYEDDERIFQAICSGASGYLSKKTPPTKLLEALQEALAGGAPISPEVARRVVALFHEIHPARADCDLTPPELRVLQLLVEGHTYQAAAEAMGDSIGAIHLHMQNIYSKVHAHAQSEAVVKALRHRPAW